MPVRVEIQGLDQLRAAAAAMDAALPAKVDEALFDSARIVADHAQGNARVRTGRMRGSIAPFLEDSAAGVRVTARRVSRGYPEGFNYPRRQEQVRPFLRPAVEQAAAAVTERMEQVLDDIQQQWGGG